MPSINQTTTEYQYYAKVKTNEEKSILGKDDFLRIFVEQLKQQDPLQPTSDKEFIAQMAQFSSLEQTMNMTTSLKNIEQQLKELPAANLLQQPMMLASLSQMIGNTIYWKETDSTTELSSGSVESVVQRDQHFYYVLAGGTEVEVSKVVQASK
ncbi:flagellar hook capping FlgD N-terminal domain-containing protein [Rubeoparvulum massiliense]|uniref:flagellar hook capping FlgD N-terminal domain-containing protein n=1 Tax=Rubeoparvulum massiliense TaxID=1631346 RepID=UPI00065E01F9|nr:flagellar hook capping FlgD N-terminal domain-containing protein [Rubeoparvulum massiliense]